MNKLICKIFGHKFCLHIKWNKTVNGNWLTDNIFAHSSNEYKCSRCKLTYDLKDGCIVEESKRYET